MELNLLALETSASRCGVALLRVVQGQAVIAIREHEGSQEHAERLLPMAGELLAQAGIASGALQAVAFGQGPGGFTGLRVACGVAQGIALGLDIPVLPVVSHLAVAAQAGAAVGQTVVVALDARMSEVYLAVYRAGSTPQTEWQVLQEPMLIAAAQLVPWVQYHMPLWPDDSDGSGSLLLAGDAWDVYAADMAYPASWRRTAALRPDAVSVARLAQLAWSRGLAVDPELAAPLYVRDKVAFTTLERQNGEGGNPKAAMPALGLQFEAMRLEDLDAVAALEQQVQEAPWSRGNFADALGSGYGCRVLRQNGRLIAYCVLMFAPDVAHLLSIAVAKDCQRQGHAGRMLDWCEQQARDWKTEGLLLEVRPGNLPALRFYEQREFRHIGCRRNYYELADGGREDALVMKKRIAALDEPI